MKTWLVAAAMVTCVLGTVGSVSADVLYTQNFESAAVPSEWVSPNADTALTIADDGTGNHVLDVKETGATGSRPLVVPITPGTLTNDNDTITLSFDVQIVTPAAGIPSNDRSFRYALFNDEGTPATSDDLGYIGRVDSGTPSTTTFDLSGANTGTSGIFGVSGGATHTSTSNTTTVLNDNLVHTITITLQRSGDAVKGSASFATAGSTTVVNIGPFTDINGPTMSFQELAIGYNSAATLEYTLDNVNVAYTSAAVPEPASLGLLGLGALAMLRRRRKA